MSKTFAEPEEREILALAIALEEEDSRIHRDFAEKLRAKHSAIASILEAMSAEESAHRARFARDIQIGVWRSYPFRPKTRHKRVRQAQTHLAQPGVATATSTGCGNGYGSGNTAVLSRSQQYCYVSRHMQPPV
jgi:Rubrerythrin